MAQKLNVAVWYAPPSSYYLAHKPALQVQMNDQDELCNQQLCIYEAIKFSKDCTCFPFPFVKTVV